MSGRWHLGIDAGGTFTDVMAVDEHGHQHILKVPSTPAHPVEGPLNGIREIRTAQSLPTIGDVSHGTTVGLNALLQRRFPPVGLIVTRGFKHVLEIARHTVPGEWGTLYSWVKPARVVPLSHVVEVDERIDKDGNVVTALNDESLDVACQQLADLGVVSIAVCLMHAYRNGEHEQAIKQRLLRQQADWLISLSSEVMPEFREYERMVTTATNAVLAPLVGQYFAEFDQRVKEDLGPATSVYVMRSAGGVVNATEAARQPLRTALSGPAAGVLGMARLAEGAGFEHAITFDMGGTSADIAAVDHGEPHLTTDASIDIYPLRTPTIDLVTIGAGGGSLINIGVGGRIEVGPLSAGALPGPVCYQQGGADPTLTDANLVLGRIPDSLLGGAMTLETESALQALAERGNQVDLDAKALAFSALEIVCNNMASAVRQVSIKRGLDPREHALVAFGGAGPMHAVRMAQLLGMGHVIVPPHPGLGSCTGLLLADVRLDASQTFTHRPEHLDPKTMEGVFAELETELRSRMADHGMDKPSFLRSADMRYLGMGSELNVALPGTGPANATALNKLLDDFHQQHDSVFGFAYRSEHAIELIALRVTAVGDRHIQLPEATSNNNASGESCGERKVLFDLANKPLTVPVYRREDLHQQWRAAGPLVVDQYDSTTVVLPDCQVRVDQHSNLIITVGETT